VRHPVVSRSYPGYQELRPRGSAPLRAVRLIAAVRAAINGVSPSWLIFIAVGTPLSTSTLPAFLSAMEISRPTRE